MKLIHEKDTLYLGYRNMALSTSGIVPKMYDLAKEGMPITLAVSSTRRTMPCGAASCRLPRNIPSTKS